MLEGKKSASEQRKISSRVLGGKIEGARRGEWQGGPVRLGFDVVCYSRVTHEEQWRVVFEGNNGTIIKEDGRKVYQLKRLKVYPDGRTERFDGEKNFPKWQEKTELCRIAPSQDQKKIDAAVDVFQRYASEAVSFTTLAHWLNTLGFRSSFGGKFQGHHVGQMLADPIYIGCPTWNRTHHGKYHRYASEQVIAENNFDENVTATDRSDWVQSEERFFEPLVDQRTWDKVQTKLANRKKRSKAPRSPALYLSGLLYCGNCAGKMISGPPRRKTKKRNGQTDGRLEYMCSTYHNAVKVRQREECKCFRNGVFQDVIENCLDKWLEKTGKKMEVITQTDDVENHQSDRLKDEQNSAWWELALGLERLQNYLLKHRRNEYDAIVQEAHTEDSTQYEYIQAVIDCYRKSFDSTAVEAELKRLRDEHDKLVDGWNDLPTQRAKDRAKIRLAALDSSMKALEAQQGGRCGNCRVRLPGNDRFTRLHRTC